MIVRAAARYYGENRYFGENKKGPKGALMFEPRLWRAVPRDRAHDRNCLIVISQKPPLGYTLWKFSTALF